MPPSRRRRAPSGARDPESNPASPPHAADPSSGEPGNTAPVSDAEDRIHYSYEEMVDHLRKVRSNAGEQGLKSKKKRRRRTHQPVREKRRRLMILGAAFVLVVLPILTFIAGSYIFSYMAYKGERFRQEMGASISETLGIQGEFEDRFSISRARLKNPKFIAVGDDQNVVASMTVENMEAKLRGSSFFSEVWRIPNLIADHALLHLRPVAPSSTASEPSSALVEDPVRILAAGLGLSGVPDKYELEQVTCRRLDADFGAFPEALHRLENLHLSMIRLQSGFGLEIDRGTLSYLYWPPFSIEYSDCTLHPDGRLEILQAVFATEDEGKCAISGEIHFGQNPSINLKASVEGIHVDRLVNPSWDNRITGKIDGNFTIVGPLTRDSLPTITGHIESEDLAIKNLPILTALSVHCGIAELKRIQFDQFSVNLHQEGRTIRLTDIQGSKPSLAGIQGEVTIDENFAIQGDLELGLPDSTLTHMANSGTGRGRPTFFKAKTADTQYGWASFAVSGDLENPTDNLDRQFEAYLTGTGSYNPRQHRRSTTFQRPEPLRQGPEEVYLKRLQDLYQHYVTLGGD